MKRQKQRLDAMKQEAEEEQARAKEAARDRVLLEFEKGQLSLGTSSLSVGSSSLSTDGTYLYLHWQLERR
jgi:nitric oxide synthase-interacting protein